MFQSIKMVSTILTVITLFISCFVLSSCDTEEDMPAEPVVLPVQGVDVPNANLRAAIREELSKGAARTITDDNMAKLTELRAHSANISDLTGLEGATNLTILGFRANGISDITPLAGLTNLTVLDLSGNNISDISPLRGLTNLTQLDLRANDISDISALQGLTNLTELDLSWNGIWDISALQGLTNLTQLDLSYNNISDISALVANKGLGDGDSVDLWLNPLNDLAINPHIPWLEKRGVEVRYLD